MTSTWTVTGGSSLAACLTSASAAYSPDGPEPTTATFRSAMAGGLLRLRGGVVFELGRQPGHRLGDPAGEVLRHQPGVCQDLMPLPMLQELLRQAERARRGPHPGVAQQPADRVAESPGPPVVLDGHDEPVVRRRLRQRLVD